MHSKVVIVTALKVRLRKYCNLPLKTFIYFELGTKKVDEMKYNCGGILQSLQVSGRGYSHFNHHTTKRINPLVTQ